MAAEAETVECWFIGGPYNNRLQHISTRVIDSHCELRIPEDLELPFDPSKAYVSPLELVYSVVDYYPQAPLPSGVPVYSCLVQHKFGRYCNWRLPSFPVFK